MNLKTYNRPTLIQGGFFEDHRGRIDFINDFDLSILKRIYFITNKSTKIIRAWQGHKIESRWFFCVEGSFEIKVIQIDNWDAPSDNLLPDVYTLSSDKPQVLHIPNGYVNSIKSLDDNSKLTIFSDYKLNENHHDDYRFDINKW